MADARRARTGCKTARGGAEALAHFDEEHQHVGCGAALAEGVPRFANQEADVGGFTVFDFAHESRPCRARRTTDAHLQVEARVDGWRSV